VNVGLAATLATSMLSRVARGRHPKDWHGAAGDRHGVWSDERIRNAYLGGEQAKDLRPSALLLRRGAALD
jgi:hypothetical protein